MANGGSVIFKFEGDTSDLEKSTKKTESALGTLAKSFTIAQVASSALNKGIQLISSNLDSAISRFDTMNNFPKVMKSLGFETKDAEKAVQTLSDGLLGLPTALDESISLVQRLTASNGNIEKSTKIYLAMNDAILAGGASAQIQASAMEQLTQAYSKGKFDAIEYKSVMSAMPGQLKQVAQYLGYTSTAIGGDLYNALQDGTLSMEEFVDAIVTLDEKGSNGMESFKKQAKSATGGIATSFKNLKTSVVRSITNVIDKIDDSLKSYGGISGVIQKLSKVISKIIKNVGNFLADTIKNLIEVYKFLKPILPLVEGILVGFIAYKTIVGIIKGIEIAMATLNAVMMANPIALYGALIAGVTVATIAFMKSLDESSESAKEQAERIEKLGQEINKTKKEFEDLEEQQNKNISTGMSEMNHTQNLANELRKLADEQGNVAEKDQARAQFILGELNKALGTEYEMIDGQIQKYQELASSIDDLIEKKKMQILFEAREQEYKEAILKWEDLIKQKEQVRAEMEEAMSRKRNMWTTQDNQNIIDLKNQYDELQSAIKMASKNINSYEDAMEENLKGNTKEAKQLLLEKSRSFTTYTDTVALGAEEQTRVLKEQQDKAIENLLDYHNKYQQGIEGFTASGLREAQDYAQKAMEEYTKVGQNMGQGIINGTNSKQNEINNMMSNIGEEANDSFTDTANYSTYYGYGANVGNGLIGGMRSKLSDVADMASRLSSTVAQNARATLGIHSPSKVFYGFGKFIDEGFANGINAGASKVLNSMKSLAQSVAPSMSGVLGDVFDLSPTLNNTTSSSSNVHVTVYNNMETDFMGNLVNNIKTFSNGSKNDYNYGMS